MVILLQTSKNNPFSLDQNRGIINSSNNKNSTTTSSTTSAPATTRRRTRTSTTSSSNAAAPRPGRTNCATTTTRSRSTTSSRRSSRTTTTRSSSSSRTIAPTRTTTTTIKRRSSSTSSRRTAAPSPPGASTTTTTTYDHHDDKKDDDDDHEEDEQQQQQQQKKKKHKQLHHHQHGSRPCSCSFCSSPPPGGARRCHSASPAPPGASPAPPGAAPAGRGPPPHHDAPGAGPVADTTSPSLFLSAVREYDHHHQQHDKEEQTDGDNEEQKNRSKNKNNKKYEQEDEDEEHQHHQQDDDDNHTGRHDHDDDQHDDEEKKDTNITTSSTRSTEKPNPDNMSKNIGDNFNEFKANSTIFIAGKNEKLRQDEFTIKVGINSQLVDSNFSLHCPNSRTKCQKRSSSQFHIVESIDLSTQDRARENDAHACNDMMDGLPSTTAERKRLYTLRNRNDHAYSFVQSNRRKDEKKTLKPDLFSPIYLKRRNKTSGSLSPAVLLDSHDECSIPEVLTHLSITETVDIFNRKTGRIINGVPIAQLSSSLRDHAEYEPIYFANNEKQSNKLYQASRTSPGGRVRAEVLAQSSKNIGKIVLVIKGIYKGTWGRIVSHIPGNWLIIRRCFSFDGNDNLNMVVHSKSVKLSLKYQVGTFQNDGEGNTIVAIQNNISATQEELKRTPSANQSNQEEMEPKRQVAAAEDQLDKYQLVMKMLDMETI